MHKLLLYVQIVTGHK